MERLSNRYPDLLQEVEKELYSLDLRKTEKCIVTYSEIPWFPGHQFSISLISDTQNNSLRVIKKSWDNEYDLKRFSSGIYNLDRLCIKTETVKLSLKLMEECKRIFNSITIVPETLEKTGYIMLDGIQYKLKIENDKIHKNYEWKIENEDIEHFRPLLNFLLTIEPK
jgi:hypothetical protein